VTASVTDVIPVSDLSHCIHRQKLGFIRVSRVGVKIMARVRVSVRIRLSLSGYLCHMRSSVVECGQIR